MVRNKLAYYQGGGGVNEPAISGQKKYQSDPAIVAQPRFKEPFYHNYDLYEIPEFPQLGPGAGYHHMGKFKNLQEFLASRRTKLQDKYVADDLWILDNGNKTKQNPERKARMAIFEKIIKIAGPNYDLGKGLYQRMSDGKVDSVEDFREKSDHGIGAFMADDNEDHMMPPKEHGTSIYNWRNSPYQGTPGAKNKKKKDINHIDFPVDEEVNHYNEIIYPGEENYQHPKHLIGPEGFPGDMSAFPSYTGTTDQSSYINSTQIAGEHSYLPLPDFEDRSDEALDFGRDYTEEVEFPASLDEADLQKLMNKYLSPAETDLFGLPDGIDPISDLDPLETKQVEQPYDTTSDIGTQPYDDKWNI